MRRRLLIAPALAVLATGCGGSGTSTSTSAADLADPSDTLVQKPLVSPLPPVRPDGPLISSPVVRDPHKKVANKDDNAANLASAVITHAFGQLPIYIDKAEFRLLPFKVGRPVTPAVTTRVTHHLTVPRTRLVLDAAMSSAQSRAEVLHDVDRVRVDVSLDGKHVAKPEQYWVYYRNNGPQICRIYFPDDLSSLQMAVNSMVWQPLSPGRHVLRVAVDQQLPPAAVPAHSITHLRDPGARPGADCGRAGDRARRGRPEAARRQHPAHVPQAEALSPARSSTATTAWPASLRSTTSAASRVGPTCCSRFGRLTARQMPWAVSPASSGVSAA